MRLAPARDLERTRAVLAPWLAAHLPRARRLTIDAIEGPEATGYSHETLLVDARWHDDSDRLGTFVVRVAPAARAVFLQPDARAEHRVLQALQGTEVRVPRVVGAEEDPSLLGAPFVVMEHVPGRIPGDNPPYTFEGWLLDAPAALQRRVWDAGIEAMAAVHRSDVAAFSFLRRPAFGAPGLDEQLGYWRAMLAWVTGERAAPPAVARALGWLEANRPEQAPLALCWGDARLANLIFDDDGGCAGVLDWEMAALADPEMDLAWYRYFDRLFSEGLGVPPLPGIPSAADTIALWEECSARRAHHQDYYEVFAAFRFAVILMRLGDLMVEAGTAPADSTFGTDNFAIDFLARIVDER